MVIRAIPWVYDGIPFRSKLEAKWYYIFKAIGLDVQYEPQAFNIEQDVCGPNPKSLNYLPDFWVSYGYKGTFVEVKPLLDRYNARDSASIWNAVLLGYEHPTMIVLGCPRSYSATLVVERHKGNPLVFKLNNELASVREQLLPCFPDEGDRPELPMKELVEPCLTHWHWKAAEKAIQWNGVAI